MKRKVPGVWRPYLYRAPRIAQGGRPIRRSRQIPLRGGWRGGLWSLGLWGFVVTTSGFMFAVVTRYFDSGFVRHDLKVEYLVQSDQLNGSWYPTQVAIINRGNRDEILREVALLVDRPWDRAPALRERVYSEPVVIAAGRTSILDVDVFTPEPYAREGNKKTRDERAELSVAHRFIVLKDGVLDTVMVHVGDYHWTPDSTTYHARRVERASLRDSSDWWPLW